ncbi:hypothetical protein, partial [Phytobacter massiliensis]|uniref:hypothetical protein n=1 Tax=Phytobacter massiliensis TaxID=1485952 RepID=UPI001CA31925
IEHKVNSVSESMKNLVQPLNYPARAINIINRTIHEGIAKMGDSFRFIRYLVSGWGASHLFSENSWQI